ncbi:MAG: phage holin family protein [Ruminococcus sp.]|nr:phage holin family protein [Ruminococcus sp.]
MSDKNNKVKYNLKNAHYALLTVGEDGAVSYAAPVPLPGSVSLSLDANGEPENFYADGIAYYVINNNMGYDGDLELALIPESFRADVLRPAVIFFYISNEGVSLLENAGHLGLPIPKKMQEVLEQLHDRGEGSDGE